MKTKIIEKLHSMRYTKKEVQQETSQEARQFMYGYTECINDLLEYLTDIEQKDEPKDVIKDGKNTELNNEKPIAYEFHNYETGHCYVDYIPHGDYIAEGYVSKPLFYANQQLNLPSDEEIENIDFGYSYDGIKRREGAKILIEWMREEIKKRNNLK